VVFEATSFSAEYVFHGHDAGDPAWSGWHSCLLKCEDLHCHGQEQCVVQPLGPCSRAEIYRKGGGIPLRKTQVASSRSRAQLKHSRSTEEANKQGLLNDTGSSRMQARDFEFMQKALGSLAFDQCSVRALRIKAVEPPAVPNPKQFAALESFNIQGEKDQVIIPPWIKVVCQQMDHFSGCAFVASGPSEDEKYEAYAFLFATQSPQQGMFLPLTDRSCVYLVLQKCLAEMLQRIPNSFLWDFNYTPGVDCAEQELPFAHDGSGVLVLQDLCFLGGCRACSDQAVVPFDVLCKSVSSQSE
jgi:hypothetical protein